MPPDQPHLRTPYSKAPWPPDGFSPCPAALTSCRQSPNRGAEPMPSTQAHEHQQGPLRPHSQAQGEGVPAPSPGARSTQF